MAYVRDTAFTEFTAAAATFTANMPDHQSGDMLIVFGAKDTTAAAITESGGNYTSLIAQSTTGAWIGAWYRRAVSNAEPAFVGTLSTETGVLVVVAVANPHGSNNPTAVVNSADDTTFPFTQTATLSTPR